VDKDDLVDLPEIVDLIADPPEHFIIYCDDLSFEVRRAGLQGAEEHSRWFGRRPCSTTCSSTRHRTAAT
jgi:hypothetical protein